VDELDGSDLPALRHEDVDLRPQLAVASDGTPAEAVPPAGLDARHHRIGSAQHECGTDELIDRRAPGEQQHDPGQHSLPRSAFEAALVHGSFRNAVSHHVAHGCDTVRKRTSHAKRAARL
jgi:hypothetical protein